MPQRHISVVLIVLCTMSAIALSYAMALFIIAIRTGDAEVHKQALEQFKDFGIFAAGALSGFLARTSTSDAPTEPVPAKIVNTPAEPVPTEPQ